MQSDEIKSDVTKVVIFALAWVSGHYLDGSTAASLLASSPAIAAGAGALAAFLYGVYMNRGMKKVPQGATAIDLPGPRSPVGSSVNLTPMTGLAKVVGVVLICFLVLHALPALANGNYPDQPAFNAAVHQNVARIQLAQANKPTGKPVVVAASTSAPAASAAAPAGKLSGTQVQQNPLLLLQQFTTSDLQAALADAQAQTPPDTTSAQCYTALLTVVNSPLANPLPSQPGLFLALQKARDAQAFLTNLQSPNGPLSALNIACAPLVVSVNNTLLLLGVTTGLVVGTGGLALPALPGILAIPK